MLSIFFDFIIIVLLITCNSHILLSDLYNKIKWHRHKIGFYKWRSGRKRQPNISWWLSFIKYAHTPYFRALSLPIIPSLALMYNSNNKISVQFLNYAVTKGRLVFRGDQNYFETILERHRCCIFTTRVLKFNIFWRCLLKKPTCFCWRRLRSRKDGRLRCSRVSERIALLFPSKINWSMIYDAAN